MGVTLCYAHRYAKIDREDWLVTLVTPVTVDIYIRLFQRMHACTRVHVGGSMFLQNTVTPLQPSHGNGFQRNAPFLKRYSVTGLGGWPRNGKSQCP